MTTFKEFSQLTVLLAGVLIIAIGATLASEPMVGTQSMDSNAILARHGTNPTQPMSPLATLTCITLTPGVDCHVVIAQFAVDHLGTDRIQLGQIASHAQTTLGPLVTTHFTLTTKPTTAVQTMFRDSTLLTVHIRSTAPATGATHAPNLNTVTMALTVQSAVNGGVKTTRHALLKCTTITGGALNPVQIVLLATQHFQMDQQVLT